MLNRRNFIQLLGGGAVGVLLTPAVYKTVYDAAYWTQNWSWIPRLKYGENAYVPTVSKICPSGSGVVIRTVSGRPVRALGSENNILSQGGLSALAASETQLACSESRVKYPLKRSADNALVRITWEEANSILVEKTQSANGSIACLSGDQTGSINDLFSAFLNKNNSNDFYLMPSEKQNAQIAFETMGGSGKIGYNIEEADCIYAIGANYLESWGATLYNRQDYNKKRPIGGTKSLSLIYAGSAQTNTASGADCFLPCYANSELVIALGVANLLINKGHSANFAGYAEFANLVKKYTPQEVAKMTGVPEARFIASVDALIKSKNGLVIVGSEMGDIGALPIMAGIACNMLLNSARLLTSIPFAPKAFSQADSEEVVLKKDFISFAQNVAKGAKAPELLYVYAANPVYALPKNANVDELLEKTGYTVCFSNFLDETTMKADLILPDTMSFERFDDVNTPYGSGFVNYSAGQPAAKAAYECVSASDVIFKLAQNLNMPFDIAVSGELVAEKARALNANMGDLLDGNSFVTRAMPVSGRLAFNAHVFGQAVIENNDMLQVVPTILSGIGTATTGIPPFATKIITNAQLVGTTMVAQVNKATADKFGLAHGKKAKLTNECGSITVQIAVFEGVQNNVLSVIAGLGHTAFDAFSQNKGDNVINLTSLTREKGTNANMFSTMYVSAEKA